MIKYHFITPFELKEPNRHKSWLKLLAANKGFYIGNINYIFCDDNYLFTINQNFLKHDTFTDIITFDNRVGETLNGEIYISINRIIENAQLYQTSPSKELLRTMAHGILHLCGYKDKSKEEKKIMRKEEEEAIKLFSTINQN
jgi:rRNA maturation RNase YbeY